MNSRKKPSIANSAEPVSKQELNSWKRGFTPQAEIWNGRMATIGLILGVGTLVLVNFFF
ncbi:high light inducible protein [Prochlorococcus marinus]|uniref:Possible high light inducible protein n=1 Tax=Prochlorococcus marinus (strain MIT 9211) TaxID=93059 RepID=A9BE92_PROM4|nr:high light inducible protein [Prochlorococcus marinus]ABX08402.1 possible high light inducible protein [Prochlorococcus marinus str. MIT 9211]